LLCVLALCRRLPSGMTPAKLPEARALAAKPLLLLAVL
jgi:hypothetical protein